MMSNKEVLKAAECAASFKMQYSINPVLKLLNTLKLDDCFTIGSVVSLQTNCR